MISIPAVMILFLYLLGAFGLAAYLAYSHRNRLKLLPNADEPKPATIAHKNKTNEILTLYLLANVGKAYGGYELLQTLLATDLQFGKMRIFHHYASASGEKTTDEKDVLFSVASLLAPGVFDLNRMGEFFTPGLVLFIELDELEDMITAFDSLLDTAYRLREDLGGELCDEEYAPLTSQKIENWREHLDNLQIGRFTGDLFAEIN